jgi:hypothetical protein
METVIYVAAALIVGVVLGKVLFKHPHDCEIKLPAVDPLGDVYVSVTARETIRWTAPNASTSSIVITPVAGKNPYPNAGIVSGVAKSGDLSSAVVPGESYTYQLKVGPVTMNGRIIIQK